MAKNCFNSFSLSSFDSSSDRQARRCPGICAGRKTVETVLVSALSLFTAINRGVNEKVAITTFKRISQAPNAITFCSRA
jgi:hypothetical protein